MTTTQISMPLGPVMVDVEGLTLTDAEITRLQHPLVGGMILFARNYESPTQLKALNAAIHGLRSPALVIAVDHEGGRVQRFREGFTRIPAMRAVGEIWNKSEAEGKAFARQIGFVLAAELVAHGVDFSFAPVLDLDWGESGVIGARAFHRDGAIVAILAAEVMHGMAEAGMASVGKHFPGHGFTKADSHTEIPVDERSFAEIEAADLLPFAKTATLKEGKLCAVMPAHVIYPQVDANPAGFSSKWLKQILREQLGFDGAVFSDDLSMEGASVAGTTTQGAQAALNAGCDMVLVCNSPEKADIVLAELTAAKTDIATTLAARMDGMRAKAVGQETPVFQARLAAARAAIEAVNLTL
jgi:beta-N-acetylhexosaminidase